MSKVTKRDLIELSHQINQIENEAGIVFWSEFKCDEGEHSYQLIIFSENNTASKYVNESIDEFHKLADLLSFAKELFAGTKSLKEWWDFCDYK